MPKFSELDKVSAISTDEYPDYFLVNIANSEDEGETFSTKQVSFNDVKNELHSTFFGSNSGEPLVYDASGNTLFCSDSAVTIPDLMQTEDTVAVVSDGLDAMGMLTTDEYDNPKIYYSAIVNAPEIPEPIDTTDIVRYTSASVAYPFTCNDGVSGIPFASMVTTIVESMDFTSTVESILETDSLITTGDSGVKILADAIDDVNNRFALANTVEGIQEDIEHVVSYDYDNNRLYNIDLSFSLDDIIKYDSDNDTLRTNQEQNLLYLNDVVYYSDGSNALLSADRTVLFSLDPVEKPVDFLDDGTLVMRGSSSGDEPTRLGDALDIAFVTESSGWYQLSTNNSCVTNLVTFDSSGEYIRFFGDTNMADSLPIAASKLVTSDLTLEDGTNRIVLHNKQDENIYLPRYITTPDGVYDITTGTLSNS